MKRGRSVQGSRSGASTRHAPAKLGSSMPPKEIRLETLQYQRQVLEQMQLCQHLIANSFDLKRSAGKVDDAAALALLDWYNSLAATTRFSAQSLSSLFTDITTEPDPGKRAVAFFPYHQRGRG
jgi:hypothetical protein